MIYLFISEIFLCKFELHLLLFSEIRQNFRKFMQIIKYLEQIYRLAYFPRVLFEFTGVYLDSGHWVREKCWNFWFSF